MAAFPPSYEQLLIDRIYAAYEHTEAQKGRYLGRLGASFLGEECPRKTWFSWRGYQPAAFGGRMLRLFQTGHLQEARIVEDLRAAGLSTWDLNPETGKQFEFVDRETGHFIVKLDGVVKGVPGAEKAAHVLEIKTHNKNSFSALQKKGVRESKPEHYVQVQAGMAESGIERGLYVAVCKDDEQLHIERIKPDAAVQTENRRKIHKLVNAKIRPSGISDDGEAFGCKFCDVKDVCLKKVEPARSCRSCVHADPSILYGEWACTLTGETRSLEAQKRACDEYEVLV